MLGDRVRGQVGPPAVTVRHESLQGSSPNLGPLDCRKSIWLVDPEAYSSSEKPQSGVSTSTSTLTPCHSPKLDGVTVQLRGTSVSLEGERFIARINQRGMVFGNQTSGRRQRDSDFAAMLRYPRTSPPVALRKSPNTIRAEHQPPRRPYHIPR